MSFLEIEGLSAGYGKAVVLRGLTLSVTADEALAVVGRNGAGKSTLLMSMFGAASVYGGTIHVNGIRLHPSRGYHAAQLGLAVAPQGKRILPNLTVRENLLLGAASRRPGYWNLDTVSELFPVLGERAKTSGVALSGGQQQMLSIGRALMANPQLLLLDEPSEGLAPVIIDKIVESVLEIRKRGVGVVLVEQHISMVRRVADRFLVLSKGEFTAEGSLHGEGAADLLAALAL
jgi:ABC-type branched-subunit amino acid transport system ATPase component